VSDVWVHQLGKPFVHLCKFAARAQPNQLMEDIRGPPVYSRCLLTMAILCSHKRWCMMMFRVSLRQLSCRVPQDGQHNRNWYTTIRRWWCIARS
jgi:hypothetical protein